MLCTNGSTTVGTGIGWLHKWCINKPPWSIELTCRQRNCAVARGVARSWRAACNPTRENFVMKTIFDCNLLFLCVRWGFFWFSELRRGVLPQSTPQNEMSKIRTDARRFTLGYIVWKRNLLSNTTGLSILWMLLMNLVLTCVLCT